MMMMMMILCCLLTSFFSQESEAEKVSHHQPAGEESDHEVENKSFSDKERRPRKALEENRKVQSSDEEEEVKTEEEKQQESVSVGSDEFCCFFKFFTLVFVETLIKQTLDSYNVLHHTFIFYRLPIRQRQRQKAVILLVRRGKNGCTECAACIFVHFSPLLVKTTT